MRKVGKKKTGRPPKFLGPRRPVTVTLPDDTLAQLAFIDPDRARAIVKVTNAAMALDAKRPSQIELVDVAPGLAIVIIGPSRLLQRIKWLRLVEVAPMRFLLSIPVGTSIDSLELAVVELLEESRSHGDAERSLLEQLRDLMRKLRRRGGVSKAEILFVDTRARAAEPTPRPGAGGARLVAK
jgi:hypothetical protein